MLVRVAIIFAGSVCLAPAPFTRSLGWGAQAGSVTDELLFAGLIAIALGTLLLVDDVS